MTSLQTIQSGWDQAARQDAMFNIVTFPDKINGGWTPEEFFEHGRTEINAAMERLRDLGLVDDAGIRRPGSRALDFGCGVGRLTNALAEWYDKVTGIDISWEMINLANKYNKYPEHVEYHENSKPDLSVLPDDRFDLVYTMIVLQHMPREYQRAYVAEFFRVLKPGGIAMFEIPDGPDYRHPNEWLSMYGVPRKTVEAWVKFYNAELVDVELIPEPSVWDCLRYTAVAS